MNIDQILLSNFILLIHKKNNYLQKILSYKRRYRFPNGLDDICGCDRIFISNSLFRNKACISMNPDTQASSSELIVDSLRKESGDDSR